MTRLKAVILGLLPLTLALPHHDIQTIERGAVEKRYEPRSAEDRKQAVIDVFRFSWEGYYKLAFPHDELRPVTNSWSDSR